MSFQLNSWVGSAFIGIISILIYSNTWDHGFNLDDSLNTALHPHVKEGVSALPKIFSTPYLDGTDGRLGDFRPIAKATYAIEYEFFGFNPRLNHIINTLLYALSCIVLFILMLFLFKNHLKPIEVFLIALLFTVHPLHTEVVNSLKNREVILMFLFGLSFIWLALKAYDKRSVMLSISAFFFLILAILSKSEAVFFCGLAPLIAYCFRQKSLVFSLGIMALFFFVYLTNILAILTWVTPDLDTAMSLNENPIVGSEWSLSHLATALCMVGWNVKLLFFPDPLLFYYGTGKVNLMTLTDPAVWFSVIFLVGLVLIVFKTFKSRSLLFFSTTTLLGALFMVSNFLILLPGGIAERFLYNASFAWAFWLIVVLKEVGKRLRLKQKSRTWILGGISLLFILPFSYLTNARNPAWVDAPTLGKTDIDHLEDSYTAHIIYFELLKGHLIHQSQYNKTALLKEAMNQNVQAMRIDSTSFEPYRNLAWLYCEFWEDEAKANILFDKALSIHPTQLETLYYVAECHEKNEHFEIAVHNYEKVLKQKDDHLAALSKLVGLYCHQGQVGKSQRTLDKLNGLAPGMDETLVANGIYHICMKDTLKGTDFFERSLEANPYQDKLAKMVAAWYLEKGNREKFDYYIDLSNGKRQ